MSIAKYCIPFFVSTYFASNVRGIVVLPISPNYYKYAADGNCYEAMTKVPTISILPTSFDYSEMYPREWINRSTESADAFLLPTGANELAELIASLSLRTTKKSKLPVKPNIHNSSTTTSQNNTFKITAASIINHASVNIQALKPQTMTFSSRTAKSMPRMVAINPRTTFTPDIDYATSPTITESIITDFDQVNYNSSILNQNYGPTSPSTTQTLSTDSVSTFPVNNGTQAVKLGFAQAAGNLTSTAKIDQSNNFAVVANALLELERMISYDSNTANISSTSHQPVSLTNGNIYESNTANSSNSLNSQSFIYNTTYDAYFDNALTYNISEITTYDTYLDNELNYISEVTDPDSTLLHSTPTEADLNNTFQTDTSEISLQRISLYSNPDEICAPNSPPSNSTNKNKASFVSPSNPDTKALRGISQLMLVLAMPQYMSATSPSPISTSSTNLDTQSTATFSILNDSPEVKAPPEEQEARIQFGNMPKSPKMDLTSLEKEMQVIMASRLPMGIDADLLDLWNAPYMQRLQYVNHEMVDEILQTDIKAPPKESECPMEYNEIIHMNLRRMLGLLLLTLPQSLKEIEDAMWDPDLETYFFRPQEKNLFDVKACRECYTKDSMGNCREIFLCKNGAAPKVGPRLTHQQILMLQKG